MVNVRACTTSVVGPYDNVIGLPPLIDSPVSPSFVKLLPGVEIHAGGRDVAGLREFEGWRTRLCQSPENWPVVVVENVTPRSRYCRRPGWASCSASAWYWSCRSR